MLPHRQRVDVLTMPPTPHPNGPALAGVMTGKEAQSKRVGGEALFEIW